MICYLFPSCLVHIYTRCLLLSSPRKGTVHAFTNHDSNVHLLSELLSPSFSFSFELSFAAVSAPDTVAVAHFRRVYGDILAPWFVVGTPQPDLEPIPTFIRVWCRTFTPNTLAFLPQAFPFIRAWGRHQTAYSTSGCMADVLATGQFGLEDFGQVCFSKYT